MNHWLTNRWLGDQALAEDGRERMGMMARSGLLMLGDESLADDG
jgi:hypothetical protein